MPDEQAEKDREKSNIPLEEEPIVNQAGKEKPTALKPEKIFYKKDRVNLGRIFFGLFILFLGLAILARSLGLINFQINFTWEFVFAFLLIFSGLSIISLRGWLGALVGIFLVLVVAGLVLIMVFGKIGDYNFNPGQENFTENINISKDANAESAVIKLKTGACDLKIKGGSDALLSGKYESNFLNLNSDSSLIDNIQEINLNTSGQWQWGTGIKLNNFDFSLNDQLPIDLFLETGASKMAINLTDIRVGKAVINTGVSDLTLNLSDSVDDASYLIKGGVSNIHIIIPESLGIKLRLESGLSSKNLVNFKILDEKHFESANYSEALRKANIELDLGLSNLDISWE